MRLLLDTHTFLWFVLGSSRLSPAARALVEDPANVRMLSLASLWEMAIKVSIGKLTLAEPFEVLVPRQLALNGVSVLDIKREHIFAVVPLAFHHKDPFDRILAAQCLVEGLPLVSADPMFDNYSIRRLWWSVTGREPV